mgnify:CR=1 FL=1
MLSFYVISRLWFTQHRVLQDVVVQDPWVARLLMLWVFTIVVLPFPSALVYWGDRATRLLRSSRLYPVNHNWLSMRGVLISLPRP